MSTALAPSDVLTALAPKDVPLERRLRREMSPSNGACTAGCAMRTALAPSDGPT